MSRFTNLKRHLSLAEALRMYFRLKTKNRENIRISKLKHPFSMRNNRYDYGTFEEVIVKEAYKIPLYFTPATIIDGGGNIGLTAAYYATKYPDAKIITIEPDKENFALLRENTSHYPNIETRNGGVWSSSAWLEVKDAGLGNNAFTVEEVQEGKQGAIRSWSIGDILKEKNWAVCDIVKLDVEGSEKEIFEKNYQDWLPNTRTLIIEMHDRMKRGCSRAVFSAVSQYNFSFDISGENVVFTNEDLR